jgi:hypothetical protein
VDKVSDTPRTDAVKSYQERCEMLHGDNIVTHAMCFARASEEADELHSLCEKLEAELAAQKEQFRVLEDELLVLGDERNAAEKALRVAVGLLSTMPQFSNMHPNDVLEGILKETKEMK